MIEQYVNAFKKHYPQHDIKVKPSVRFSGVSRKREPVFRVIINGDAGDRALTSQEMAEAVAMWSK